MKSLFNDHHTALLLVNVDYMSNLSAPSVDTLSIPTHVRIYSNKIKHTQTRNVVICLVVCRFNVNTFKKFEVKLMDATMIYIQICTCNHFYPL